MVVIATAVAIAAGGLMASNMGFKLNYPLKKDDAGVTSKTGRQTIGLPYNRQVGIDDARQLLDDIDLAQANTAFELAIFNTQLDTNEPYPGSAGNFNLAAGEGYLLRVVLDLDYIIVGSHDPGATITLVGQDDAGSKTGRNRYTPPYHGVPSTARQVLDEIGANAFEIAVYNPQTDTNEPYPGSAGNFTITPGAAYLVRIINTTSLDIVPSHY